MDISYNENCDVQRFINLDCLKVTKTVLRDEFSGRKETMADFGVSTGCNADIGLECFVEEQDRDKVVFIGVDQQSDANWKLFRENMEELRVRGFEICNGDFYENQVVDHSRLDLSVSFWSLHWVPMVNVKNSNPTASYCNDDIKKWRPVALANFKSFLDLRKIELRPGAIMVLTQCCTYVENKGADRDFYHIIVGKTKQSMFEDGLLNEEEMKALFLPIFHKTKEEIDEIVISNGAFESLHSEIRPYTARVDKKNFKAYLQPYVKSALNDAERENIFWSRSVDFVDNGVGIHLCILKRK